MEFTVTDDKTQHASADDPEFSDGDTGNDETAAMAATDEDDTARAVEDGPVPTSTAASGNGRALHARRVPNSEESDEIACWDGAGTGDEKRWCSRSFNTRECAYLVVLIADLCLATSLLIMSSALLPPDTVTSTPLYWATNVPQANHTIGEASAVRYPVSVAYMIPMASIFSFCTNMGALVFSMSGWQVQLSSAIGVQTFIHHMTIVPVFAMISGVSSFQEFFLTVLTVLSRMVFLLCLREAVLTAPVGRAPVGRTVLNAIGAIGLTAITWALCIASFIYSSRTADYAFWYPTDGLNAEKQRIGGGIACLSVAVIIAILGDAVDLVGAFCGRTKQGATVATFYGNLPLVRMLALPLIQTAAILRRRY